MIEVFCEFPLEIAHSLPMMPEGHKCRRVHGHSYRVRVTIRGPRSRETGMIFDYALLEEIWMRRVHAKLDHQNLNELHHDFEATTSEVVVEWIAAQIDAELPAKVDVTTVDLWETARFGARWTRPVDGERIRGVGSAGRDAI